MIITETSIPGAKKLFSGKVRDIYEVDDRHLVLVSTDRVSAFDHVFPNGIPDKGRMLKTISNLWFKKLGFVENHLVETDYRNYPAPYCNFPEMLEGRSVLVKKCAKLEFECIARGYIIGSGWKDYQTSGAICGISLPAGLRMAEKLPQSIFTPSTKAEVGHDENISFEHMETALGVERANEVRNTTLRIFDAAGAILKECGILLADTKLEFGILDGRLILIDEVITPDSSRFWDAALYQVGTSPASFDKQFIRDYLDKTTWDKNSAAPALPEEIVAGTAARYREIMERLHTVLA
jgi:phosphoribosylaminoimidazole-succinocarboxamide synthase